MGVTIDVSEVRTLAADMRAVDRRLARHIIPAVDHAAVNVKGDMRDAASRSRHFRMANSISYDKTDPYEAEIGPVKGGAGSLANIAYFGGANGGGGTVEDPQAALDREAPKFERSLADLAVDLVFG